MSGLIIESAEVVPSVGAVRCIFKPEFEALDALGKRFGDGCRLTKRLFEFARGRKVVKDDPDEPGSP